MIINLTNKRYGVTGQFDISQEAYYILVLLHPKRTEEALQHMLSISYGHGKPVTPEMIEKVIYSETEALSTLNDTLAMDIYQKRGKNKR